MSSTAVGQQDAAHGVAGHLQPAAIQPELAGQVVEQHRGADAVEAAFVQHAAEIGVGQIVAAAQDPLVHELEDRLDPLARRAGQRSLPERRSSSTSAAAFCS